MYGAPAHRGTPASMSMRAAMPPAAHAWRGLSSRASPRVPCVSLRRSGLCLPGFVARSGASPGRADLSALRPAARAEIGGTARGPDVDGSPREGAARSFASMRAAWVCARPLAGAALAMLLHSALPLGAWAGVQPLLTRWPDMTTTGGIVRGLDYFGCVIFAVSGALTASVRGMDLLGCTIVAVITAIGGGTWRDILMGAGPVFWIEEVEYIYLCAAVGAATSLLWPRVERWAGKGWGKVLMDYGDALGVAAFCIIGAHKGLMAGFVPIICAMLGMCTATFGGVTRDVLCRNPPRILHSHAEIYATCALVGASVYIALRGALTHASVSTAVLASMTCTMVSRHLAMTYDLKLPTRPQSS